MKINVVTTPKNPPVAIRDLAIGTYLGKFEDAEYGVEYLFLVSHENVIALEIHPDTEYRFQSIVYAFSKNEAAKVYRWRAVTITNIEVLDKA